MTYPRNGIQQLDLKPQGYPWRIGPVSTRTRNKRLANQMEAAVLELALLGIHEPLDALRAGRFTLPELYSHKVRGTLDLLMEDAQNPLLREAIAEFRAEVSDPRYLPGLARLEGVAPDNARVSWLDDPRHVQRVLRQYEVEGLSPATERRELPGISQLIRRYRGDARRDEIFRQVTPRTPKKRRTRWLTSDEVIRVREHSGDWWPLIGLALGTGLRRGEILALGVCDLDFKVGTLVVQHGKSVKARRMVPLAGELLSVLKQWVEENELEATEPLFSGVTKGGLRYAWEQIREAAAVEDVTFHGLRHTYAVACAKAGMPLPELQQRLGHEKIDTTMRYAIYSPPVMSPHHQLALEGLGLA